MAQSKEERRRKIRKARKDQKEYKGKLTDPETGLIYRKSFYGRTLEEAVQKWRDTVDPPISKTDDGLPELVSKLKPGTVEWWFLTQLFPLKGHLRTNSVNALQTTARLLLPELQGLPIAQLSATTLSAALDRIERHRVHVNAGAKSRPVKQPDGTVDWIEPTPIYRPIAPRSVNKCRLLALEINALAHESNPAKIPRINGRRVRVRKEKVLDVDVYSPPQMGALRDAARNSVAFVPVLLYGFLGLRLNEGIGAQASDLHGRVLEVTYQDDGEGALTDDLKTDNARRALHLPPGLLVELRAFAKGTGRLAKSARTDPEGKRAKSGRGLTESGVRNALFRAMGRAGLHRLPPHHLRHSFSSWLENEGCPTVVRLAILGQSRASVSDRYNHPDPAKIEHWIGRFWEASLEAWEPPAPVPPRSRGGPKTPATGERNGRSRLGADQVRAIRARLGQSESPESIAKDFPVDPRAIRLIRDGITWKHLT